MSLAKLGEVTAPSTSVDSAASSDGNSCDASTKRNFSCGICFELYTRNVRYPISLGCGHTFCVMCVRELSKYKPYIMCGICRKHTMSNYKRLGKNFILLDLLERSGLLEEDPKDLPAADSWMASAPSSISTLGRNDTDLLEDLVDGHGSSLGISQIEMEDLYNTVENINDYLFGYMRSGRTSAATSARVQELSELRNALDAIETSLIRERRAFRDLCTRANTMLADLRSSSIAADAEASAFSHRDSGWGNSFYDEVNLFGNDLPTISISIPENNDEDQVVENFIRREYGHYVCYLCDVRFFSTPTSIRQHINGRRHRDLLVANNSTNVDNWEVALADLMIDDTSDQLPYQLSFTDSTRSRHSLPTYRNRDRVEVVDLRFRGNNTSFGVRAGNNAIPAWGQPVAPIASANSRSRRRVGGNRNIHTFAIPSPSNQNLINDNW